MHFTNTPLQSSLQMLISRLHLAVDMQASKVFACKTTVMSNMSIPSMKTTWLSIFGPENIIVLLRYTKKNDPEPVVSLSSHLQHEFLAA